MLTTWVWQLVVRQALPAQIPVSVHAILTLEEHRARFVLARSLLVEFRRNLPLVLTGQRRALMVGRVPVQMRQKRAVLFQRLDRDGNGSIIPAELLQGLGLDPWTTSDPAALAAQLCQVLQAMDLDGDGLVDAEQFGELMLRLQRLRLGKIGCSPT